MKSMNNHQAPVAGEETDLEPNASSKKNSRNQRRFREQVSQLHAQGFSLRQIGKKLQVSHVTVQRILQKTGAVENVYSWGKDEFLTRSQIQRRLQQTAKSQGWDSSPSALAKWEGQILEAVCGGKPVSLWKIGYLLATGPTRRGRKLPRDRGMLLDESLGKKVDVFSDYYSLDKEGNRTDKPVDFGEYTDVFSSTVEPYFAPKRSSTPRVPPGTLPLECPRCQRMTLYQEPPCRILEDDGGWKLCTTIGYRSKCCKAGTCTPTSTSD